MSNTIATQVWRQRSQSMYIPTADQLLLKHTNKHYLRMPPLDLLAMEEDEREREGGREGGGGKENEVRTKRGRTGTRTPTSSVTVLFQSDNSLRPFSASSLSARFSRSS